MRPLSSVCPAVNPRSLGKTRRALVLVEASPKQVNFSEPLLSRHPWFTALLLGTLATPAGVIIAWLAPRPLDAVVALPLVLVDVWSAASGGATGTAETPSTEARTLRLLLLVLGIVLTWMFYVAAARLLIWRLLRRAGDGAESG